MTPFKGFSDNEMELTTFYPPMGASPLIAYCEELTFFGAKSIILVCSSWSLGEDYLQKNQIHIPNFSI